MNSHDPDFKPILVSIIHGTFDIDHPWARVGATIPDHLSKSLGERLVLREFNWTGHNAVSAREIASRQLADYLAETETHFPGCKHYLVGHSHAGNIIRTALDRSATLPSGVVTISTPFLRYIPRRNFDDFGMATVAAHITIAVFGGLIWLATIAAYYEAVMNLAPHFFFSIGIAGIFILILLLPLYTIYRLARLVAEWGKARLLVMIAKRQEAFARLQTRIKRTEVPFFCIYPATDEVDLLFKLARLITSYMRRSISFVLREMRRSEWRMYLTLVLVIFSVSAVSMLLLVAPFLVFVGNMAGHGISLEISRQYGPLLLTFLAITTAFIPLAAIVGRHVFGTENPIDYLAVEFHNSFLPPKASNKAAVAVASDSVKLWQKTHNAILYNPKVATLVAGRIESWAVSDHHTPKRPSRIA